MGNLELTDRLDLCEIRLDRLEERLELRRQAAPPPPRYKEPPQPASAPAMHAAKTLDLLDQVAEAANLQAALQPAFSPQPVSVDPSPATVSFAVEQNIGIRWAGWAGAVVLVIGAAMGIKFGYDHGWFNIISPQMRMISFALAGLGLIAAGEWVYRGVNPLSAAGLFGAGIATLFVVSYSGHAYYDLYPPNTAFVLMGISTLLGALVAGRANMVSIAVLSLIGGNLAPAILTSGRPELLGFLIYLLMLQAVAVLLAAWGAQPRWWTLRGLSLATTSLWMATVISMPISDSSAMMAPLIFSIGFAALFQLELLVSASNSRLVLHRAGAVFSTLVTAAMTVAVLYLLRNLGPADRLTFVLGVAGATGIWSLICWKLSKTWTAFSELSIGFAVQSAGLLIVAVPIALSGIWIAAAWGMLAIAFAVLGYGLNSQTARRVAPVLLLLALAYLAVWPNLPEAFNAHSPICFQLGEANFNQQTLMYFSLAVMGQIIAKLTAMRRNIPGAVADAFDGQALSVLSSIVWVLAAVIGLPPMMATLGVLLYTGLLILFDFLSFDLNFLLQSAVIATLAGLKWAIFDLLGRRLYDPPFAEPLLFSTAGLTSLLILANFAGLYFRAAADRDSPHREQIRKVAAVLTVGALFWIGSFDIDQTFTNLQGSGITAGIDSGRGEQMALSIFWSAFAIGSICVGFARREAAFRYAGLGLFALTSIKVVLIDLSQVSTGYRILSFMGLGFLLLLTSVLYGKLSPRLLTGELD